MPMGCASPCKTFECFSSAIEWIAIAKLHITYMIHLLDYFLIIASSATLCSRQLSCFLDMCDYLGIPIAPDKTMGPATVLSFAVVLNLTLFTLRHVSPLTKSCGVRICFQNFSCVKRSHKDLQSLIGLLNFTCTVVLPGSAFLHRLIDLTIGINRPQHLVRLRGLLNLT